MANRFPIVIDTTSGNQFRELPAGDNLILTGSNIVNALNISAVGSVEANRLVVNGQEFTNSYNDLNDLPDIPDNILDLNLLDGTPGQVLTTNGLGVITFQNIPLQDPVLGGDLSGTASNAQIRANTIGVNELDVDEGNPGDVLATDGAGSFQFIPMGSGGDGTGGATSFLGLSGTIGLTQIQDDFITEQKIKTSNDGSPGDYLTVNAEGEFTYVSLPNTDVDYEDILNKPTIPTRLTDLAIVDGTNKQVLIANGNNTFQFSTLTEIENISFTGSTISTVLSNSNISLDPNGNGYVSIEGTNALIIPKGTTAERNPTQTGAIRYNTDNAAFEGYDGTFWGTLGGIKDADSDTYITAESSAGADEDTLTFYTGGTDSITLSNNLMNIAQGVNVKINSTQAALDFDSGALSVDGGVSIRGNLLVSGSIDVDQTFDTSAQIDCSVLTETITQNIVVAAEDISFFKTNQRVRLFRASPLEVDPFTNLSGPPSVQLTSNLNVSAQPVGFSAVTDPGNATPFRYRIAQMDANTGKISPSTDEITVEIPTDEIVEFNNNKNIQLLVSRQSPNHVILIYRKIGGEINYKLTNVLGTKDLGASLSNIQWTDYYDFDLVDWSGKDATNAFTENSGIVHLPITAPTQSAFGWIDTVVQSIDLDNNIVVLGDSFYASDTQTTIVIDDTQLVQQKIDLGKTQNRNSLELENRTYYISQLSIPTGFTLYGQGDQTRLIKLPWSTQSNGSNAIIKVDEENYSAFENISIKNLRINGNSVNQHLTQDIAQEYLNYAVYVYGRDILFENLEIQNTVGGGIYTYDNSITQDLTILNCEITDGALSYVYEYAPINVRESRNVKIAHNTFRNFTDAVNIGAVRIGIVSPNVVNNCGSGIFAYGASKIVLTPNVILGAASEFIQNPDVLNSEYDSVNILIEPNLDFNSTQYVYQENGEFFNFRANQGRLTAFINELIKTNNVEELGDDYSQTLALTNYIEFTSGVNEESEGNFSFRITKEKVNDLLSRANYATLIQANPNSQGLVYRIVATEYVEKTTINGASNQIPGGDFVVPVTSLLGLNVGDTVRLANHATTPPVSSQDGVITALNTVQSTINIDFGGDFGDITENPEVTGEVLLQNNFVVVKGKIN